MHDLTRRSRLDLPILLEGLRAQHATTIGWAPVIASWEQIFAGDTEMDIEPDDIHCEVQGSLGYVSCKEVINTGGGKMAAINIFRRQEDGGWRMAAHHAGPIML